MELFIIRDGQQAGPFSESLAETMLSEGALHPEDMAWHKGMAAWTPLEELLRSTREHAAPPPIANAARPASARQKALLHFLGIQFPDSISLNDAALSISDAFENPKLTERLAKWGSEKLRLHPELFQEELDFRRANRVSRLLELCQTEGAEVVKDVTKAHVQVLTEALDKRDAKWDQDSKSAVWDFLLPAISEHFPQLVRDEWKGKLKMGRPSKVAAAYSTGLLTEPAAESGQGAVSAIIRGIVFGLLALGALVAGIYFMRHRDKTDGAGNESKPPVTQQKPAAPPPASSASITTPTLPVPTATSALPPPEIPAAPPVATTAEPADLLATTPPSSEPTPEALPSVAEQPLATPASPLETPAPASPTEVPAQSTEAPVSAAPSGPVARNSATLMQPVTVQLQFGTVTLNKGTRVRLIALEGQNARVNFNNNIIVIPVASTDVDPNNTVVAPPTTPAIAAPTAAPQFIPTNPTRKPAQTSDL